MKQSTLFSKLEAETAACSICERMCDRQAVLSKLNGSLTPKIMFIAEAPGRNGADRTRIPFHGDASGETFEKLLASIGLAREEIFITNTVLCSPRKPSGANDKPTRNEIRNCSDFLRRTIEVIDPPIIATLGAVALDALKLIEPHEFTLEKFRCANFKLERTPACAVISSKSAGADYGAAIGTAIGRFQNSWQRNQKAKGKYQK